MSITVQDLFSGLAVAKTWPISEYKINYTSPGGKIETACAPDVITFYSILEKLYTRKMVDLTTQIFITVIPYSTVPDSIVSFYPFTSRQVQFAEQNSKLFNDGVSLAVAYCFKPDPSWYQFPGGKPFEQSYSGDQALLHYLDFKSDHTKLWSQMKKAILPSKDHRWEISLPYISIIQPGRDLRDDLIKQWDLGDYRAKYAYIHMCQTQAVFIMTALAKYLFGSIKNMWIRTNQIHTVLTNYHPVEGLTLGWSVPFYFDLIAQQLPGEIPLLMKSLPDTQYIPIDKAGEWYIMNYDRGRTHLESQTRQFISNLLA